MKARQRLARVTSRSSLVDIGAVDARIELQDAIVELKAVPAPTGIAPETSLEEASRGSVARRYRLIGLGLALSDAGCVVAALVLAHAGERSWIDPAFRSPFLLLIMSVAWVLVFHAFGLYAPQHLAAPEELRRLIGAASVGVVLVLITIPSTRTFSRFWVAMTWAVAVSFELFARRAWRWYQGRLKADGRLAYRTLIVGTSDEASCLFEALSAKGSGFAPFGCVQLDMTPVANESLPILGSFDRLEEAVNEFAIECLFVASTEVDARQVAAVTKLARRQELEVCLSANAPQILTSRITVRPIGRVMALSLKPARLSPTQIASKRAFDVIVASIGLVLTAPISLTIAIVIRLTSRGPVLFRQERATKGGRAFTMYKFRTMVTHSDQVAKDLLIDLTQPFFKVSSDPRLTRVGRFIRSVSLDEIPQLLNVIRGDMSLVGPRPLPMDQVMANWDLLSPRLEMQAGVTGWWQINGRSELDPEEAVRLDLFYIENWSLTLDMYVVAKTIGAVLARRGAV